MQNLKTIKPALLGACMFKVTRKKAALTATWQKERFLDKFNKYLTKHQEYFLFSNWHLFEAIELVFAGKKRAVNLYLVRLIDHAQDLQVPGLPKRLMIASSMAKDAGINVYMANVIMYDDWKFRVDIVIPKKSG